MSLVRTNAVGHGDFALDEPQPPQTALEKTADEEQTTRETVIRRQDAERPTPTTPPAPPESHHPPPAAPQTTAPAADTKNTPDAAPPAARPANRPRVGSETLAFHADVAAGDTRSIEAYLAKNADKIIRSRASRDGLCRKEDTGGFAALLVVPAAGPNSDPDSGAALSPLEVVDLRGRTPLHTACAEGQADVVRVLLRAGADASAFDSAGFSPLHRCAQSGDLHSARALLDRRRGAGGADGLVPAPAPGGAAGTAAAAAAAAAANPEMAANPEVDALTRRGDYRPLHLACYAGSADMVGLLVRRGADLSAGDKWGASPLHRACLGGHLAAARAVLDAGAEVDPRDMWKSTPLHRACQSGHADIVELLLRKGASTSAQDDIKHRPAQSFDNDVSSEQRQVIANLLERSEKQRSTVVSGRGTARSPTSAAAAWGRTRSGNTASAAGQGGLQRTQSRYIPPAARAAAAAAAAADTACESNCPCPPGTNGTTSTTSGNAGVQPWRRKTSTLSGLAGDRGPDVDGGDHGYERDTRGGSGGGGAMGDESFAAGRAGGEPRGSEGFGGFRRGEEEEEEEDDEEEEEEDDDEEMFELEMSVVVDAVEGRLRTGAEARA